jgi:hypothetical protein
MFTGLLTPTSWGSTILKTQPRQTVKDFFGYLLPGHPKPNISERISPKPKLSISTKQAGSPRWLWVKDGLASPEAYLFARHMLKEAGTLFSYRHAFKEAGCTREEFWQASVLSGAA